MWTIWWRRRGGDCTERGWIFQLDDCAAGVGYMNISNVPRVQFSRVVNFDGRVKMGGGDYSREVGDDGYEDRGHGMVVVITTGMLFVCVCW